MFPAHSTAAELARAACTLSITFTTLRSICTLLTVARTRQIWDEFILDVDTDIVFHRNADDSHCLSDHIFDVDGHVAHADSCTSEYVPELPYEGHVFLGDLEFGSTLSVPLTDTQPHWPLFDGGDAQDENGLTDLWPPHGVSADQNAVLVYTDAEFPDFGQWMQDADLIHTDPIQQPGDLQISTSQRSPYSSSSTSTECQRLLQIVRRWLSDHASQPYPSRTEKEKLAESTGCSVDQVEHCFTNTRAREKHCKPDILYNHVLTTPLTLHLVFDGGHAKVRNGQVPFNTGLHANVSAQSSYAHPVSMSFTNDNVTCPPATNTSDSIIWPSQFDPGHPMPDSNQDTETQVYQHFAAESARQEVFSVSALQEAVMPKRKGRRYHAQRHLYGTSEHLRFAPQQTSSSPNFQVSEHRFPCTVCVKAFKNASDWKRHEASVHGYNDREWVCMLTDAFKLQSECVFCLEPMDSIDHLDKHAIDPCSDKCTAERSFPRKDLLKQHVLLAHLTGASPSIKKTFEIPTEWSRGLDVPPGGPGSRWCGFCKRMLETTAQRMDHVAQHFRKGQGMTSWIRI